MFQIKKSGIPGAGKGLFTTFAIKKEQRIMEYTGEKLSWIEVKKRYPDLSLMDYIFHAGPNNWIDSHRTPESLARYANDAKGLTRTIRIRNNSEYRVRKGIPYLFAVKNIPAGGEILVDYGDDYWIHHHSAL